jgi:hypothetical protein
MLLSTPAQTHSVDLTVTAPTVIPPGERMTAQVRVAAKQPCELTGLQWDAPQLLTLAPAEMPFPVSLPAGGAFETGAEFLSDSQREGFGELRAALQIRLPDGAEETLACVAWISVFTREVASDDEQLSDPLRRRLMEVVNARARNGHIFLADYAAFFDDFLNVEIPQRIAERLSEEFNFPSEGLPLDAETRYEMILGNKTFYGIERLELIAEEECEESDDRFDPTEAREVLV